MAKVINIQTVPFDLDEEDEISTSGECSQCGQRVYWSTPDGFPDRCPGCGEELECTDGQPPRPSGQ